MSRVLLTGATGFIGGHVARELRSAGWAVRCLVRPAGMSAGAPGGVELVAGDVRDARAVRRAAEGVDAIVHVAALYCLARHRAAEVTATNVGGTANVIAAARATGARLVHTSSVATIGMPADGRPGDEDTPLDPEAAVGAYKRSKIAAERLVLDAAAHGLPAVVVNPTAPVGPGDRRPTPTGRIVRDAARGRLPAYVDTGLNLVDVRDVAVGHRLALERGVPGRRYLVGGDNLSLRQILHLVAGIAGRRPPRVRLPHGVAVAVAGVSELVEGELLRREPTAPLDGARMARTRMWVDSSRARRELGVPRSPVTAALAEAVAFYAHAG